MRGFSPCLLFFLSLMVLSAAEPAKPSVPVPAAADILARLKKPHPRLLASQEDFAQLKARLAGDAQLRAWHTDLQAQAEKLLSAPVSRYEIPDGLRLLATSRQVVSRVYTLGLLYRLDGEAKYAERAWQELAAAASFPDWNPRHFLDTAEMTHAFAIGYDWLYEVWTPEQRSTLRKAMVEKGLKPALRLYRTHGGFTKARNNWNQVCNGGIGMGALALGEAEPELAGEILHSALESLPPAMAEFEPDGACKEGPGYWHYATSYNVIFLAGLQTALGTDFGLAQTGALPETGFFPIYLTGPLGRSFNYADGGDRSIRSPQMFWLAQKFNQPVFAWPNHETTQPSALDLVWFRTNGMSPKDAGLPLDKYFRGAEVALLRSEWGNSQALFAGFKAGDNKASHSHLDLGSFVFDAAGARWAMDLGADNYNLPGYFGHQRWNYYRLRAEGQNTLVINPGAGPDQIPTAATRIIRFESKSEKPFAVADLTPAYQSSARRVWRGIALLNRKELLVQDEIEAAKPAEVWWFMHTPASVRIRADGRSAVLKQAGAQLHAVIVSPKDAKFELRDAEPLPGSPHPEGQAKNENISKLAIHLQGVTDSRLVVMLMPVLSREKEAPQTLHLSALSEW